MAGFGADRAAARNEKNPAIALYPGSVKAHWSLAEVLASTTAGYPLDLTGHGAAHALWWDRLRHEAGLLTVEVPELDIPRASPTARSLARGFALASA